ncbi:MAG: ComEC/Rec2 family competence protein [bacterium]
MVEGIIGVIILFVMAYFVYLDSQKRNMNVSLWTTFQFILPLIMLIVYLVKRKEHPVTKDTVNKKIPGFRTNNLTKKITAIVLYALYSLFVMGVVLQSDETIETDNTSNNNQTEIVQRNNNTKESDANGSKNKSNNASKNKTEISDDLNSEKDNINTKNKSKGLNIDNKEETKEPLSIHFLDVGQADCILIKSGNESMLVDAGNRADDEYIYSYLKDQNINELKFLVGTHPHEDHIGSMSMVLENFEVGQILMPKAIATSQTYENLIETIQNQGKKVKSPMVSDTFKLGEAIIYVLAPNSSEYQDINNYSIVLKVVHGKNSFLLTGDAEDVSELEMLNNNLDVEANVLKVGHHGSHSSTSNAFLDAVEPEYAVICAGKDNRYGHPHDEVIYKLNNAGIEIYRTDEAGTIIATSDGETIKFDKKASPVKINAPPNNNDSTDEDGTVGDKDDFNNTTEDEEKTHQLDPNWEGVFLTETGSKYHDYGCRFLDESAIPITTESAIEQGYEPCGVCKPE